MTSNLGTSTRSDLVRQILWKIACLPADHREQYLRGLDCSPDICDEVRCLLPHLTEPIESFIQGHARDESERPPDRVADYLIESRLGAGGMGVVYEARQEHLDRSVALKLIRADHITADDQLGLLFEARVLASLHHPNIAQVFDAGVFRSGQAVYPYIAMEHIVNATTLTLYAHSQSLCPEDTLPLLIEVCGAIDHGHQRGVIHRDIKPSNILVDAQGNPKVIDFGIAVFRDRRDTSQLLFAPQTGLVGTLPYMAPELIEHGANGSDTRADIYALGVVMYQLICESLPYPFDGDSVEHYLERIVTGDCREPRSHCPSLHRDINAIILCALHRAPDRRYRSAADLALDIQRYLDKVPVHARNASRLYLTTRFVQRNLVGVVAALVILALIMSGTISTGIFALRESQANRVSMRRAQGFETLTGFLVHDVFSSADPRIGFGPDQSVRSSLELATERLDQIHDRTDRASVTIRLAQIHDVVGEHAYAERLLREAVQSFESSSNTDQWERAELSRAYRELGRSLSNQLLYTQAEPYLALAAEIQANSIFIEKSELVETLSALAGVLNANGKPEDADRVMRTTHSISDNELATDPPLLATVYMREAQIAENRGNYTKAEEHLKRALSIRDQSDQVLPADLANTLNNLGVVLIRLGLESEAKPHLFRAYQIRQRILPKDHSNTLQSLASLAYLELQLEEYETAMDLFTTIVEMYTRIRGGEDLYVAWTLLPLGIASEKSGDLIAAELHFQRALNIQLLHEGSDLPGLVNAHSILGEFLLNRGRLDEARTQLEHARLAISRIEKPNTTLTQRTQARWDRLLKEETESANDE